MKAAIPIVGQVGGRVKSCGALGDALVRTCKHQSQNTYLVLMRKLRGADDDGIVVVAKNKLTQNFKSV